MHIPNEMLSGAICPVTAVVSSAGIITASYFALKSKEKPSVIKFASVAAVIFAFQMLNFPIQNGTSGHLLGGALASALLGTPFGILAVSMVLIIQALVFSDGGIALLGANILNMAIIGAGVSGILFSALKKGLKNRKSKEYISLAVVSFISVVAASFACGVELAISGTAELSKVLPAMLSVHAVIALFEIVITIALYSVISISFAENSAPSKIKTIVPILSLLVIAIILAPIASSFPDGLESVALKLNFLREGLPTFVTPFSDYNFKLVSNPYISTAISSIVGIVITFAIVFGVGTIIDKTAKRETI